MPNHTYADGRDVTTKWQWYCRKCQKAWNDPDDACGHDPHDHHQGRELMPALWKHCVWQPKWVTNQRTLKKISDLQAAADTIRNYRVLGTLQRGYQLTPNQIQQLRHRGYNV